MPLPLLTKAIKLSLLIVSGLLSACTMSHPFGISCTITINQQNLSRDQVLLTYQIYNNSEQSHTLLTWYTPLEGMFSDMFLVTDASGKPVTYQGVMIKRTTPTDSDYLPLAAHSGHQNDVNIAFSYPLSAGRYQIQLKEKPLQLLQQGQLINTDACQAAPVTIVIP